MPFTEENVLILTCSKADLERLLHSAWAFSASWSGPSAHRPGNTGHNPFHVFMVSFFMEIKQTKSGQIENGLLSF